MGRCTIQTCRNFSYKTRTTDKSIKYHAFPKDENMRFNWIKALQKPNTWVPDYNTYVCSEHFLPTDFERDLKAELLKLPPKRILKPEAVPSLCLNKGDVGEVSKKKARSSEDDNKENETVNNGYVISYLGKPRLLITHNGGKTTEANGSSASGGNNQSRIISLNQYIKNHTEDPLSKLLLEKKNVFKLDDLCRLCGSYSNRMTSIFNEEKCYLSEAIENYFSDIKVNKDDILPTQICFKCESSLTSWCQFHKTCNTVNRRFQSILKKLVMEPDVQQKLASKGVQESSSEDAKDEYLESIDEDVSYVYNDHDDDSETAIEIVEVSPELFEPFTEDSSVVFEPSSSTNSESYHVISHSDTCDYTEMSEDAAEECDEYNDSDTDSVASEDATYLNNFSKNELKALRRRYRSALTPTSHRMCHMCGKVFKYPESLRRHLKTVHSDERPFKCHLCTSSFNRNHNLTIHIKVVHQRQRMYPKKQVPRLCDYCGKVLLSARSLEEHISSMHTKKALYECDKCHTTFYRKLLFEKHRTTDQCSLKVEKNTNPSKLEEVFLKYCEFCGLEFKKEHFYIKHKLKHMTSFSCPVCLCKFEDGSMLKDHMNMEHPEVTPFECQTCGKKFKTKSLLSGHAVIHSGEKRHQCHICSLKFLKKKYLTTHILTHTGERPFVCTICGRGFRQSGDMRKHKANHIRKQLPERLSDITYL